MKVNFIIPECLGLVIIYLWHLSQNLHLNLFTQTMNPYQNMPICIIIIIYSLLNIRYTKRFECKMTSLRKITLNKYH